MPCKLQTELQVQAQIKAQFPSAELSLLWEMGEDTPDAMQSDTCRTGSSLWGRHADNQRVSSAGKHLEQSKEPESFRRSPL